MNLFFWKRPSPPNTQGFRTLLEAVTRELRMQAGEISQSQVSSALLEELNTLESSYLGDLRELQRRMK